MIAPPRPGTLTQGTVFCGARAENYANAPVWGVVITARCDAAHEKTPIVNYLPAVRIDDWLDREGGLIVVDRALNEQAQRFKSLLIQRGLNPSLMDVYSPREIAAVNFKVEDQPPSKKLEREQREAELARTIAAEIEQAAALLQSANFDSEGARKIIRTSDKCLRAVVAELLSYRLAGYYFLPELGRLTEMPCDRGYVVLLREVHHVPRDTARQLIDGVARDSYSETPIPSGLCLDQFDFAFPVAEIESPWIEHLMQAFCTLFGRIGVADIDKARVSAISEYACKGANS